MDWDLILAIAAKAGVNYHARHQWKSRGVVPHRWRNIIVTESNGKISWVDLARMDRTPKPVEIAGV